MEYFQLRRAFFEGDSKDSNALDAPLLRVGVGGPEARAFIAPSPGTFRSSAASPDSARTRTL